MFQRRDHSTKRRSRNKAAQKPIRSSGRHEPTLKQDARPEALPPRLRREALKNINELLNSTDPKLAELRESCIASLHQVVDRVEARLNKVVEDATAPDSKRSTANKSVKADRIQAKAAHSACRCAASPSSVERGAWARPELRPS
jgi:hypothetical protein